ncbi:MAG: phosphate ABC transporter substrate-binding protein [Lachnospiraceae bacterium]|nr:phosphate ABC transporter substrate-binding protein [Lachnospiraceae bacterium]
MAITVAAAMAAGLSGCGSTSTSSGSSASQSSASGAATDAEATSDAAAETTDNAADTAAETTDNATDTAAAEETKDLSGTITMAGSTSMEKLANAVAESFMEKYPNVTVTAEFTGSGAGIESVLAGSVDIGNSSRNLKDSEIESGAVENIVAIDGIAVVTDTSNAVANLTKDELISIYTGEITNWSDLGGDDSAIVVVGREAGSGTRGAFEELLEIEDQCAYANELDSTGAVMAKVASTPGAVGYVSLDVLDDSVSVFTLEVVTDTSNAVANLTKDELISIYTGEITNWSDLGGDDSAIVVVGREAGSGTRGAFEELLEIEDQCAYANELDSTGAVMAKVASTPGAVGYVSLDVLDDSVSVFTLEGVEATAENILAGDYFLCRPFVMATLGEISEQSELVQEFFAWLSSDEGQAIVEAVGLITVE